MTVTKSVELTADDRLLIIDQTLLPNQVVFLDIRGREAMVDAIRRLQVRGAPAIGIFAAYCVYLLALSHASLSGADFQQALGADICALRSSRPTAVNLAWALERMDKVLRQHKNEDPARIIPLLRQEAKAIDDEDAAVSGVIAQLGEPLIHNGMGILTHCNAGWLATSRLGTALAPLYLAHEHGKDFRVYCDETRPLLQGARLTAYELSAAGINTTLICDNMAASLMAAGKIDIVFVGADRVAANGDVANKIGTLSVAVNAAYFGIPFYVCAPCSTLDPSTASGKDIVIEQRDPEEVRSLWYSRPMAPRDINICNPAFDVTPRSLITGIITEKGII